MGIPAVGSVPRKEFCNLGFVITSYSIHYTKLYEVWEFPNVDSCKNAEKEVKKSLYCGIFTKAEIPDGWTETTSIKSIEQIIQIYKKYNGTYVSNINTSTQEE